MTDQEMLEQLHKNPSTALEQIIDCYAGLIYAIARNKLNSVGSREDIEDCVSDIFAQFYEKRGDVDLNRGSIKSFLMILAKRTAIKRFQKLCGEKNAVHSGAEDLADLPLPSGDDTEQEAIRRTQRRELLQAVKDLGEPDCGILLRKYFLGQTAGEIGKALSLSKNAVEKRAARSLVKLKEWLGERV
ncbi:sigma-70 family RNA polymerase sigma factor [Anaerolentibacter hominis]|uniref:sigma-70 family RNA polymerase sigma factor n=1 Tax=Anaerolentibacter hominis TaxID=3079009 RepID=UPI0031B85E20